jgi:hypothetical protein
VFFVRFQTLQVLTCLFSFLRLKVLNLFVVGHEAGDEGCRGHRQVDLLTLVPTFRRKKEICLKQETKRERQKKRNHNFTLKTMT